MATRAWAMVLAVVAVLAASWWLPFISDDALISLRYAERAAQGLGLTWTDGERVEGYTDFLWVVLNIPSTWLHVDGLWWSRLLGVAGFLLAVWSVAVGAPSTSAGRLIAGLLMATSAPLAVWAIGGLEHTFLAGLLALALALVSRERWWAVSAVLAAVVTTRADGVVLLAGVVTGVALASWGAVNLGGLVRRLGVLAALPVLAVVAQTLFRRAYYGEWVPNTALAKVAFNQHRLQLGVEWVRRGLTASGVLVALALVMAFLALRTPESRRRVWVPLTVAVSWFAYVALVGGDIFPAWRQLVPGLAAVCFVAAEGLELVTPRLSKLTVAVGTVALLAAHMVTQWREPENLRGRSERWEWAGEDLGQKLARTFSHAPQQPLLAVDAAGALSYWSRLPSLDMLGLNDAWIPRHPPPGFGTGPIGHELGDGAYVFRRQPDLIAFCGACGARAPCFVGGRQLLALPEFSRDYGLAFVEAAQCRGAFWVRQAGGPLAVQRTEARVELTAWHLAAQEDAALRIADDGTAEVAVDARAAAIAEVTLPAGAWRVADDGLLVSWRCGGLSASRRGPGTALTLTAPTRVQLSLRSAAPRGLRAVTLERVEPQPGWGCTSPGAAPIFRSSTLLGTALEHDRWDRGGALVFGAAGARVEFDTPVPAELELSVDNNDTYVFTWLAGEQALGRETLAMAPNGGGLALRRVHPPAGTTAMTVTATGDGAFSIGHLKPLP